MNAQEFAAKKQKMWMELDSILSSVKKRKGKSACTDTWVLQKRGLLQPIVVIKPTPGKTKEETYLDILKGRIEVAKKVAKVGS